MVRGEIDVRNDLRHPNLLQLHEAFETHGEIAFILELYVPLASHISQQLSTVITGPPNGPVLFCSLSSIVCRCRLSSSVKPGPHQQQCRSNIVECYNVECCFDICCRFWQQCRSSVRLCCQKRQQCRTSFALKFRPFDKVERCFDIVAVACCFDNVASTLLLVWTGLNAAGGPAAGCVGGRHCTAGQYRYVPLGRHFVIRPYPYKVAWSVCVSVCVCVSVGHVRDPCVNG